LLKLRKIFFNVITILNGVLYTLLGRDSSLDIATRYGLDGPGIESRWGDETSPHTSVPSLSLS